MKTPSAAAVALLVALTASGQQPATPTARSLAKEAYDAIEEHPFERQYIQEAAKKLERARKLNPNESYVWLAAASLVRTLAYQSGDWIEVLSFEPGGLEEAMRLTKKAIEIEPGFFEAHIDLAWIYIPQRMFDEARREFTLANKLKPNSFDVWYGISVSLWKEGEFNKSMTTLERAEKLAVTKRNKKQLLRQKERVAMANGDAAGYEAILKEYIRMDPDYAWAHGNYGLFLMQMGRYAEAVAEYEKAVKLTPYPLAVKQLAQAKRLRDQARSAR